MSDTELTAAQVAEALTAYGDGHGYDGRTDWYVITDYDNTPYSVRSTSGPWITLELGIARELIAGWQAREELAALKTEYARLHDLGDEFIWGENNPAQYESEMTKLRSQLAALTDQQPCVLGEPLMHGPKPYRWCQTHNRPLMSCEAKQPGATPFSELRAKMPPEAQQRAAERTARMLQDIDDGSNSVTASGLTRKELHSAVADLDTEMLKPPVSTVDLAAIEARPYLVHEAYVSLLRRAEEWNEPDNHGRRDASRFERHVVNAALDLRDAQAEIAALRATNADLKGHFDSVCQQRNDWTSWAESMIGQEPLYLGQDQLRAKLSAALRAGAGPVWWPIETAPKDGTDVLMAWADGHLQIEALQPDDAERFWFEFAPMHWMPLPAPPQLADAGDGGAGEKENATENS